MNTLLGFAFKDWWQLLKENRFNVDAGYRRRAMMITIASILNSKGRKKEDRLFSNQIDETEIKQAPVFILGHWRSGTTLLHSLMTVDQRFAYPTLFEVSNPHTFLTREDKIFERFKNAPARKRAMDNVEVTIQSPAEDEFALLLLSLRSPNIGWIFPRRELYYDRYLNFKNVFHEELQIWKSAFTHFLKKLTLKHQKPLILKSPGHTSRVKILLEMFPDAKFIHIHRNPFSVFKSTQKLYAKNVPLAQLQKSDNGILTQNIIKRYAVMYNTFFEDRKLLSPNQYFEVGYEELVKDKLGHIRRIYQQLGIPGFKEVEPGLQEYINENAKYQKNVHQPLEKSLHEKIINDWHQCFEEWGYSTLPAG